MHRVAFGLIVALALLPSVVRGGDWPQILGPNRNGVAVDEKLPESFPAGWPKRAWDAPLGSGFAGPAVAGGKVLVFHRQGDKEICQALDAARGTPLWKAEFPASYQAQIVQDDGPLCVPVVAEGRVFLFGAAANLHCVSLDTGEKIWSRDLKKEYGVPSGYFGSGSTPIVEGKRLLVNVGARGAGIAAFNVASGELLWKATDAQGSYSSPIAGQVGGKRQAIFVTRYTALGLDPASGEVAWEIPFGQRGPTVNGASPVLVGDHLFLTSSYGVGAVWAKLGGEKPQIAWANDKTLSSQYTTPIYREGFMYGVDGRQDVGVAELRCIDPNTARIAWNQEGFGKATLILAGDKLLAVKTDGELVVAQAAPEKYVELAKSQLSESTVRALPALAHGRLYVRDTERLRCFEVGAGK